MIEVIDSDSWCTKSSLARLLGSFDTDPCSNARSHIRATTRYTIEDDGLSKNWRGSVFVNGPYSNPLPWCRRLARHSFAWCALWKLDPTTAWFEILANTGAVIAPFRNRLKFERPDKPNITANFPSVLIYKNWQPSEALAELLWIFKTT